MSHRIVAVLALLLVALAPSLSHAQERLFSHPVIARDAERYEASLIREQLKGQPRPARELRAEADRIPAADPDRDRRVASLLGQALVSEPRNAGLWLAHARALLAIKFPEEAGSQEKTTTAVNASAAAYVAYERADTVALRADALAVLAEGLKRRSLWRAAIDALKASLATSPRPEVQKTYEALRAEHGFRIADYKVDSDAAQPRLCIQFSERLANQDLAKFLAVNGREPQSAAVEARQICIEGLQHGQRYEVQVRAGLPSATDETLLKTADIAVYVKDRAPAVRFSGKSYVLPSRGQQGIPVVTVNTREVGVEIYRVGDRALATTVLGEYFMKQVSGYDIDQIREKLGAQVFKGVLTVPTRLNEDVTTALPVGEVVRDLKPGVYVIAAEPRRKAREDGGSRDEGNRATQWFIVSDLGISAFTGEDGLHGFVRALSTATPVEGVSVRLVARNNEILATAKSDARGYVRFDAGLKRGEGGQAPALLVAEGPTGDYAFLDLTAAAFDLSDRGVAGREPPGAVDAFLYTDRGVYRGGEQVHLAGLVRDRRARASTLPVTLILVRPDGVEHRRTVLPDQGLGGRTLSVPLGAGVMTGSWKARLHVDPASPAIAEARFLVEDFVPERLDLKLEPEGQAFVPGQPGRVRVTGRFLYGPPAAGLELEGEVVVKLTSKDVPGFPGFRFGLAEEKVTAVRGPLEGLPRTDGEGKATIAVVLPALPRTQRPLEADVLVRLKEPGGRTIERTVTMPVLSAGPRIGIKALFGTEGIGEGEEAAFNVVLAAADGTALAAPSLNWELSRLEQSWQWYSRDGAWTYDSVTHTRRLASGKVATKPGEPGRIAARPTWGRYRLDVTGPDGAASSYVFTAGWAVSEAPDSPEMLEVALDKPRYKAGDTAKLRIVSKQAGRAVVAVLDGGLAEMREIEVPAGGAEVAIPVKDTFGPGAYVTATLFRPMDEAARRMPGRAVGVRWLAIEQDARKVTVGLDLPQKVASGGRLVVPLKLGGLAPGEAAYVTVAAVDVGVLNLTRFKSPAPEAWFLAQRKLGIEMRDLYGRLIDGMRAERGVLRSGGDDSDGTSGMKGNPPVEETLAKFSGIVRVGPDGTARVEFDLPDFNGSVRVMAVAWSEGRIGSASGEVIVRDPVALTISSPRFLTLGDEADITISAHNVEGAAGTYQLAVAATEGDGGGGRSLVDRGVALGAGERRQEKLAFKPDRVGPVEVSVRVSGPGGIDVKRRLKLDVKVPAGDIRRTVMSQIPAGGRLTLSADVLADLIPERSHVSFVAGPYARFDVAGLLASLDRYPYGCAEQTTSRALPLLYLSQMSSRIGLAAEPIVKTRVQDAIERLWEMQDNRGAFGIWGPSTADIWLSAYVVDFLTRAREQGFTVKPQSLALALDRLQNFIGYTTDFEKGGEEVAYALYVLARNGRAPVGELRYYVDTRLDRFASPLAKAQLGAALALTGDKDRAERAFKAALAMIESGDAEPFRHDYGSRLRDGAALVSLAAETKTGAIDTGRLADVVARAFQLKAYTSTQEQAWMLLAARALGEEAAGLAIAIDGQRAAGPAARRIDAAALKAKPIEIRNEGDRPADVLLTVVGAALTPEPPVSRGLTIERTYYSLDGKSVDVPSGRGSVGTLAQNQRLVVVLKIKAETSGGRVLLVDRLPAGLEIENPRLVEGGDLKGLDFLKGTLSPEHTEFRDDRFVAAFNLFGAREGRKQGDPAGEATVAYMVRVVTPGRYVHPAATVEDMYRPERHARTASGQLVVRTGQ